MNKIRWYLFILITVLSCLFYSGQLIAQDSTMKHQWGIGSWPHEYYNPYLEIHYKTFFHKKKFYNISLAGWYNFNRSTPTYDGYNVTMIPSAEIGVSLPFFKICRFNAAARTSFYVRSSEIDYKGIEEDFSYLWMGGFIGPSLGLEIVPYKSKKCMFSLFGYLHSGFGYMHRKYSPEDDRHYNPGIEKESIAIGVIGVAIRY